MSNKMLNIAIAVVVATFSIYANEARTAVVIDGLVSYWTCDQVDVKGDVLKDAWGENHGKMSGNPKIVAGKFGEGMKFDESKFVEIPSHESFDFGDGGFTLSAWINIKSYSAAGQWSRIVGRHTQSPPRYGLSIHKKVLAQVNGTFLESSSPITEGQWYYLTFVRDGASGKIYINGKLDKSGKVDGGSTDSGGNVHIATKGNKDTDWFRGTIDEVSIYNKALSDAEVAQNFKADGFKLAVNFVDKLAATWGEIKILR